MAGLLWFPAPIPPYEEPLLALLMPNPATLGMGGTGATFTGEGSLEEK